MVFKFNTILNHTESFINATSFLYSGEPLNNEHGGDEHFVHCLEVVPSSEVEMYGQLMAGGKPVCPL